MVNKEDLNKEWYKPGEIAKMLGVTPRTILRYNDFGEITMKLDEEHNRWYMSKDDLILLLINIWRDYMVNKSDLIKELF